MLAERGLRLELTEQARLFLAEAGYDPSYGARPLKRAIQQYVQDPLALALLEGRFHAGDTIHVDVDTVTNQLTFTKSVEAEVVEA